MASIVASLRRPLSYVVCIGLPRASSWRAVSTFQLNLECTPLYQNPTTVTCVTTQSRDYHSHPSYAVFHHKRTFSSDPSKDKEPSCKEERVEQEIHPDAEREPLPEWPDGVNPHTGERGGPRGPEPTRYGDWERKGRVSDF